MKRQLPRYKRSGSFLNMKTVNLVTFGITVMGFFGLIAQGSIGIIFIDEQTHILALIWLPILAVGLLGALCLGENK
tara:strand:+ start:239 stop:466 length:228 start_codon:yes stop_codon:yes gene_type:complete